MPIVFRSGWKPTPPEQPRVRLTAALRANAAPSVIDRGKGVSVIGMHLNDTWGCCTCAADANIVQQQTFYGGGTEAVIPDSAVLAAYEKVGKFNPSDGPPGENPTDQGATVPAALAYLKKTGMTGHKIAAYGEVDVTEIAKIRTAIWEFGGVSIGLNLPNSAMTQFNAGKDWFVDTADESIDGGHCVYVCGYNANGFMLWTWDKLIYMDIGFWNVFVEEAWAPISKDWVNKTTGEDPDGVNLVTLGAEFLAITGQNPFPASPSAAPTPTPSPAPDPSAVAPKRSPLAKAWRRLRYGG
jgi:hypothetical protein